MSQIKKLNAEQLQTFINFIHAHQLKEAENLLIETIQLSPKASESLVQLLHDSHDALAMFKDNPQILDQEHQSDLKTESKSFEFNFHSSKVKITDKDGRSIEVNDQQPEWESIKKQLNINLTEPNAISELAENIINRQFKNHSTESADSDSNTSQNNQDSHHTFSSQSSTSSSGVEDLTKHKKPNSILLLVGFVFLFCIIALYYLKF